MAKKILSHQDSTLFRQTIGEVKAIKDDKVLLKSKTVLQSKSSQQPTFSQEILAVNEPLTAEDSLSFLTIGLHKEILKKLRNGYFRPDAELDLHGLTSEQAKHCLQRFLDDAVEEGCQCVHIIHGKGYRSSNSYPVLKNNINHWLRQYNEVQAFCSASAKEGGAGAGLVLLHLVDKYR